MWRGHGRDRAAAADVAAGSEAAAPPLDAADGIDGEAADAPHAAVIKFATTLVAS